VNFRIKHLAPGHYRIEVRIFFDTVNCQSHWDIGFWVNLT